MAEEKDLAAVDLVHQPTDPKPKLSNCLQWYVDNKYFTYESFSPPNTVSMKCCDCKKKDHCFSKEWFKFNIALSIPALLFTVEVCLKFEFKLNTVIFIYFLKETQSFCSFC